jgi:hypothetical protein
MDVCQGGAVMLDGVLEGPSTRCQWIGGKGEFADRGVLPGEYTPSDDEIGTTVAFTLVAISNDKNCPNDTTQVRIRVNPQPRVSAGSKVRICAGDSAVLRPVITGAYQSVNWVSTGTGTFDDSHIKDAVYRPSLKDQGLGAVSLQITVIPQGVCLEDSDAVPLTIEQPPVVTIEPLELIEAGKPVKLSAKSTGAKEVFSWKTTGNGKFEDGGKLNTSYTPTSRDIKEGFSLELTVVSATGVCVVRREVGSGR